MLYTYNGTYRYLESNFMSQTPRAQPSRPCGSTACPRPCMSPLVRRYRPIFPAFRTRAGWTSSRTGHRSPWAALCSPWCSCTSWPSWGESSFQARRFSLVRNGSSAPQQGRGRCWRISRNICGHQFCKPQLGSCGECCSSLCRLPCTDNSLWSITIVLGALVPLAVELHGVRAGHVVDNLFLHVTVGCLNIGALVVILCSHVDLVRGVAHSVLP